MGSKLVSCVSEASISVPALNSCLDFWWWTITIKPNRPQAAFGHGVYDDNRNLSDIFMTLTLLAQRHLLISSSVPFFIVLKFSFIVNDFISWVGFISGVFFKILRTGLFSSFLSQHVHYACRQKATDLYVDFLFCFLFFSTYQI